MISSNTIEIINTIESVPFESLDTQILKFDINKLFFTPNFDK